MDLHVPKVEIVHAQKEKTNLSLRPGKRDKVPSVVEEILAIPSSKKNLTEQLTSKSSSSEDDLLESFRDIDALSSSIFSQFEQSIQGFETYKEERSALDIESKKDHIEVLQHIQSFREDLGSLKGRMSTIEELYKILNDGLSATQQNEALRNKKLAETHNESETARQKLNATLEQMQTNANLYTEVKQQYNNQIEIIEKLEKLYTQLADTHPIFNQTLSNSPLNPIMTPETSESVDQQIDTRTLEDILTQLQAEILEMKQEFFQLKNATKKEPDYQKIIDNNHSLMRKVQLWMTASTAVLMAGLWFWWQAHKAS